MDGSHFKASAAKARLMNTAQLARHPTQTELAQETEKADKASIPRAGLTVPDSVMLSKGGAIVAGYNVQQAVNSMHKFIIAHEVTTTRNDHGCLLMITSQAQQALGGVAHRHRDTG